MSGSPGFWGLCSKIGLDALKHSSIGLPAEASFNSRITAGWCSYDRYGGCDADLAAEVSVEFLDFEFGGEGTRRPT